MDIDGLGAALGAKVKLAGGPGKSFVSIDGVGPPVGLAVCVDSTEGEDGPTEEFSVGVLVGTAEGGMVVTAKGIPVGPREGRPVGTVEGFGVG